MAVNKMSGKDEIIDHLPKWVKFVRDICIDVIKKQAPEEYEKLKQGGYVK